MLRFLDLGLADPVPDANTIWTFREALKRADAVEALFRRFDAALRAAGYLAMGGQIIDATIVAAPRQRNTAAEKAAIKAGRIPEGWAEKPAKLRQKDRDARWTVKFSKAKPREDGAPQVDLAVPAFGYKSHVSIDRRHGLIRRWTTSDAAAHDGARLAAVLDGQNTASDVWADTAYRSAKNETLLTDHGLVSRIHRKKPKGRPMARTHPPGERAQIRDTLGRRARLCPAEGTDGAGRAHHRHRPGARENRARQSRLQHETLCLAQQPNGGGVIRHTSSAAPPTAPPRHNTRNSNPWPEIPAFRTRPGKLKPPTQR